MSLESAILQWFRREKFNPYHDRLGRFANANETSTHHFVSTSGVFAGQKNSGTSGAASTLNYHDTHTFDEVQHHKEYHENASKLLDSVTKDELDAIVDYTMAGYQNINKFLGGKTDGLDAHDILYIKERIEGIDSALSKASIPSNIVVERATNGGRILKSMNAANYNSIIGKVFIDKAFGSTTTKIAKGANLVKAGIDHPNGIKLRIRVPAGSKALSVEHISRFKGEYEILIHRNAKYQIRKYDEANNVLHVDLLSAGSDL